MQNPEIENALRKNIQKLHHRESFRFLLAVWPDTWWWFVRMQDKLGELPSLQSKDKGKTEILSFLERCAEHGNTLGNGKLRGAIMEEIERVANSLSSHKITCKNGDLNAEWDWVNQMFEDWATQCSDQYKIRKKPKTDKPNHTDQERVKLFMQSIFMHEEIVDV